MPSFRPDPEALREIVTELATADGRMVNSPGHQKARRNLLRRIREARLNGYHAQGHELSYQDCGRTFRNLVGVLTGSSPSLEPVVLVAHYDTCGVQPGADDNAAAIAVLLSLVEPLRAAELERSVVFAFFDAEEPPYFLSPAMGSNFWYRHQREEAVHAALVLDLVGHAVPIPGWEDLIFVTGMESDPALQSIVRSEGERAIGFRTLPTLTEYVGDMSDYSAFRLDERPYLFFSCGQWEHYHMPTDTPDRLDYEKMADFARYLLGVTIEVSNADFEGPFEGYDTTPFELERMRSVGGEIIEQMGVSLETRQDLDGLIHRLLSFGLLGG
jgi:hypothetical protein